MRTRIFEKMEQLTTLYYEGETTFSQEQELFKLLQSAKMLTKEQRATLTQLETMQQMRVAMGVKKPVVKTLFRSNSLWLKVACVAVVVLALGTTVWVNQLKPIEPTVVCYIDGKPIDDMQIMLEQLKYLEPVEDLEASLNEIEKMIK